MGENTEANCKEISFTIALIKSCFEESKLYTFTIFTYTIYVPSLTGRTLVSTRSKEGV
ncbi:MAG: hypothetical protein M3162_03270 [Thermoproteota archaeon]|nr:hypothetical protein [Thermoproteota archaeon]